MLFSSAGDRQSRPTTTGKNLLRPLFLVATRPLSGLTAAAFVVAAVVVAAEVEGYRLRFLGPPPIELFVRWTCPVVEGAFCSSDQLSLGG